MPVALGKHALSELHRLSFLILLHFRGLTSSSGGCLEDCVAGALQLTDLSILNNSRTLFLYGFGSLSLNWPASLGAKSPDSLFPGVND